MIASADRETVRYAIERGTAYLVEALAQSHDGLWRDYLRSDGSGGSNVWVSAFIAAQIGHIPAARAAAGSVVTTLLRDRRETGGWGYDDQLLEDVDSTAWVLLAARATATTLPREVVIPALRFLLRHQTSSGGFVTYGPEGVRLFGDIAGREGWFEPQPCVTAAALAALATYATPELPPIAQSAAFLERTAVDDLWHAYWWYGPTYATCYSVRALSRVGRLPRARADAVASALLRARNDDGGWSGRAPGQSLAFSTALGLSTLLELGLRGPTIATAASYLVSQQQPDGSFGGSAELLVPGGNAAGTMTVVDRGEFTTACVLGALHRYLSAHATSEDCTAWEHSGSTST